MEHAETGQVIDEAAEVYENFFVPALFGQWPQRILNLVDTDAGMRILDVGCGTGVFARAAHDRVGGDGSVVGIDPNPGMLRVARRSNNAVTWHEGTAESLPFEDGEFDRVVSQFALMFFSDRSAGLGEMSRVGAAGATAGVATWAALETSPGYAAMVDLLNRLFGPEAAEAMRAPFVLSDPGELNSLLSNHFDDVTVHLVDGVARFRSIDAWVHTDIRGWTLADMINDVQFDVLLAEARRELAEFVVRDDGQVEFPAPALVATGHCRGR